MKIHLILFLLFLMQMNCIAQFGPQQIISIEPNLPNHIYAADLDGDGDMDVLSSSQIQISWYENINGDGVFGEQRLIAQNPGELGSSVSASDIDGDGDLDVLSTFIDGSPSQSGESRVVWNENLDGLGNFGPQRIISLNAYRPTYSEAADFDGDGDMDVLSISRGDNKVAWYRNLDGLGNFGPQIIISIELDFPIHAFIADIDNDGDMDIVSHSLHGDIVGWFRNLDGNGTFSNLQVISTNVDFPNQVYAADLDGDGDMDVISTSKDDNKIAWYENINGNGNFGPQRIITTSVEEPNAIYASDIDNDGDLDLISASSMNGSYSIVSMINSNGLGDFESPQLISDEVIYPNAVITSDLDQDGDADVLSSSQIDSKIAWYENYTILGIEDIISSRTIIYPNPCQDFINIYSDNIIRDVKVFDFSGKSLDCDLKQNRIDTTALINGIYLLELIDELGSIEFFKIVKQ